MFKTAIEIVSNYTRPIHSLSRKYESKEILAGAATLFFVNEDGYAITCKHVVEHLMSSDQLNQQYNQFKAQRALITRDANYAKNLETLEKQYVYSKESVAQIKNTFIDCVDTMSGFTWLVHPYYDLAIIKFNDFNRRQYTEYATFKRDTRDIKQGEFLCRLGYPFAEFTNYEYSEQQDDILWTNNGIAGSPKFPLEGMLTRFLMDSRGQFGIELSTPGLKGQSGGPLFNADGIVCGMQFSTKHLHLGFDIIDKEIRIDHSIKKVSDYSFIHLGQCIHVDVIKSFLRENNVKFYEESIKTGYNFVLTK